MRRKILLAAAPACVLLAVSPVAARAELAPPGDATATAVQVGQIVGVSSTGAHAAPDTATSRASVLQVGGEAVLGLGGSQNEEGETGGALIETGTPDDVVTAQVAPWEARVTGTPGQNRSAKSRAALARAGVDKVIEAHALESESEALHRAEKSTGSGVSNGLRLRILEMLDIVLLHSEVQSEGKGSSYLVGINDTEIGTDEQLGQGCALEAAPLLAVSCLAASGGEGDEDNPLLKTAAADVASAESEILTVLNPIGAFVVEAASGDGTAPAAPAAPVEVPPVVAGEVSAALPAAAAPAAAPAELPRTGSDASSGVLSGLLAVGAGGALLAVGRRRRSTAA